MTEVKHEKTDKEIEAFDDAHLFSFNARAVNENVDPDKHIPFCERKEFKEYPSIDLMKDISVAYAYHFLILVAVVAFLIFAVELPVLPIIMISFSFDIIVFSASLYAFLKFTDGNDKLPISDFLKRKYRNTQFTTANMKIGVNEIYDEILKKSLIVMFAFAGILLFLKFLFSAIGLTNVVSIIGLLVSSGILFAIVSAGSLFFVEYLKKSPKQK